MFDLDKLRSLGNFFETKDSKTFKQKVIPNFKGVNYFVGSGNDFFFYDESLRTVT